MRYEVWVSLLHDQEQPIFMGCDWKGEARSSWRAAETAVEEFIKPGGYELNSHLVFYCHVYCETGERERIAVRVERTVSFNALGTW